jgi:NTE family protein
MATKKKIGLVLSGGGMHGFAQIGAIKVLEKYNIKPDLIVGSSVGALVGAVLAAGLKMDDVEDALLNENLLKLIKPTFGPGLIKGEAISRFALRTIKVSKFDELKTRLIINATNLSKSKEVVFEKGPLLPALTASISIPGIFTPVNHNDDLLVDGGFYDVIPLHLAEDMDIIIIIDVSNLDYKITPKSGVLDIMKQSVVNLQRRIIELNLRAHVKTHEILMICPNVSEYSMFEYKRSRQKEMIKLGEDEARKVLGDIRARKILGL